MVDFVELSLFINRTDGICDEMGERLRRSAFSTNIRDRLDYSCALFDAQGGLLSQSAAIPVHLGSMAYALADIVDQFDWAKGDTVIFNDPFAGGTHLPDVTLLSPFFWKNKLCGFVANRAHHSDIGASVPGGMPVSSQLSEEGIVIRPCKLVKEGVLDTSQLNRLVAHSCNSNAEYGDYMAQIGANRAGLSRLDDLLNSMGFDMWERMQKRVNDYGERLAKTAFKKIKDGEYYFSDVMDDDGFGNTNIKIAVCMRVKNDSILIDFTGTSAQVTGNINCPLPVTAAAVYYVFRCLLPSYAPTCKGVFSVLNLQVPKGSLLNATAGCAVAAGNTETSQRIVDCLLGALNQALSEKAVAASQGTMNNLALGNMDKKGRQWAYYETIAGGMGAGDGFCGHSAVQTHMTNTLNTPAEILELEYPLRITNYQIRQSSGGQGRFLGGDGLIRTIEFLEPAQVTLLTERRVNPPWGEQGGGSGLTGVNLLNNKSIESKTSFRVSKGDHLSIKTPGGGGWGV